MTAEVPEAARQLAGRLADAFEQDRGLAEQLSDCQDRLRAANGQLWSGLHPDALGLIYDDAAAVGAGEGSSVIAASVVDALRAGLPAAEVEAAVLPGCRRRIGRFTARSQSTSSSARTAGTWPRRSAS